MTLYGCLTEISPTTKQQHKYHYHCEFLIDNVKAWWSIYFLSVNNKKDMLIKTQNMNLHVCNV